MASAFKDAHGWIADFRALSALGRKRRRVRIDPRRAATPEEARAFAAECERYCRLLERDPYPNLADVAHARRLGAITEVQAAALRSQDPAGEDADPRALTLRQAFGEHPSTRRERRADLETHRRYERHLDQFSAWSGVSLARGMTLDLALRYLDHLRAAGNAWPTRRHKLMPLRRACRMAASHGLADPLAGFRLDRNEDPPEVRVWTMAELCRAALHFQAQGQTRALAALALGGFLGLRSSEICRALAGDLEDGVLHVGRRRAKNQASRRALPLPETVRPWLETAADGLPEDRPIVAPAKRLKNKPGAIYSRDDFFHWLGPALGKATGRVLPPKCLRKSFATWTIEAGCDPLDVEAYLGHRSALVSVVTARHYLAARAMEKLRPAAARLDAIIKDVLQQVSTGESKTCLDG